MCCSKMVEFDQSESDITPTAPADAPVSIRLTGAFGNAVDGAVAFGPKADGSKG